MTRMRLRGWISLAVVLALALTQIGSAQQQTWSTSSSNNYSVSVKDYVPAKNSAERTIKFYSLDDLGGDATFGEWIEKTITSMTGVEWSKASISYYAPKNILVVCHTPAVHAKVETLLKDLKKSLPEAKKVKATVRQDTVYGRSVVPAGYSPPGLLRTVNPTPEPGVSYPVPAPVKPPKHLFHFIIRYEGEGIVDDNIVKAMKTYTKAGGVTPDRAGGAYAAPASPPPTLNVPVTEASDAKEKEEKKEDKKDKEKKNESSDPSQPE